MSILARFTNILQEDHSFLSLEVNSELVIYFDLKNTRYDLDALNLDSTNYTFQLVSSEKMVYITIQVYDSIPKIIESSLPLEALIQSIDEKTLKEITSLARVKALLAVGSSNPKLEN